MHKLKYVTRDTDRYGNERHYVRIPGLPKVRIRHEPGSAEFEQVWKDVMLAADQGLDHPAWIRIRAVRDQVTTDLRKAIKHARERSIKKGVPFALEIKALERQLEEQNHQCLLTGIDFEPRRTGGHENNKNPWSVSIDRIEPEKGYVASNIRLICVAMNLALQGWGEEVFQKLVDGYVSTPNRD